MQLKVKWNKRHVELAVDETTTVAQLKGMLEETTQVPSARIKLMAKGVKSVVFDRNGYRYHGRVAAVAAGAREAGLEF